MASEEIYQILRELAEDRVVVSYISEYGTSDSQGCCYIALAGDIIMASPSSLTGSVGAVALLINYTELMDKLGVEAETFKSGLHEGHRKPLEADDGRREAGHAVDDRLHR
ncbi:MAG: S49 family peptidase [Candidatus Korarchaeota archaeon]|nr:S49 family peptidase [Candidatus Korarchaeota archaeon]